jgi:hypothetical protein
MAGGEPLVVSAQHGRGRIVQFAIPCDDAWTSLPLRLVYLPMMQQLILDLAGQGKADRIDVGQPIAVPLSEFDAMARESAAAAGDPPQDGGTYTLELPDGDEVSLQPSDDQSPRLTWSETGQAGTYRFRRITSAGKSDTEPTIASTIRVIDVPEVESQLRDAPPDQLAAAAERLDATVYTEIDQLRNDDRVRRFGREIWRWLLLALLLFLILELFVQQRLVRSTIPVGTS